MKFNFKDFLSRSTDNVDDLAIFKIVGHLPCLSESGPWIAGGAIRRTLLGEALSSDVDVFFASPDQMNTFIAELGGGKVSESEHNTTFLVMVGDETMPIQCIHFAFYDSAESLLDSFDFTITQFATDGASLWCGEFSLWDLACKRLALHKLTFGTSTLRRVIKYTRQGFTACSGVLADILEKTIEAPGTVHRKVQYID